MLSCIYLTRKCPHRCHYCRIVESPLYGQDMTVEEWKRAFTILRARGVKFHLILGNEPLLYDGIVELMDWLTNEDGTPYGFYTTSAPHLHEKFRDDLVDIGIANVSSGVDAFPLSDQELKNLSRSDPDFFVKRKSTFGYRGMLDYQAMGVKDLHGSFTLTQKNQGIAVKLLEYLTGRGIWSAFNVLHWDQDGGYDFFPPKSVVESDILSQEEMAKVALALKDATLKGKLACQQTPEYFDDMIRYGADLSWHCSKPVIYSVDCDGSMRCCGYRRGHETQAMHVFDLETDEGNSAYWEAWAKDSGKCPGCFWSYWWQAEKELGADDDFGHRFFQFHANKHYADGEFEGIREHTLPVE